MEPDLKDILFSLNMSLKKKKRENCTENSCILNQGVFVCQFDMYIFPTTYRKPIAP